MNQLFDQASTFVKTNPMTVGIALTAVLGLIILIIVLSSMDTFEGMISGLKEYAEYPATFAEAIVPDFVKESVYDNYFVKSTETVKPYQVDISQLELPTHTATVPIDIGNGMAVEAKVQIPAQTVSVPSQVPITLPEAQKTDVVVTAQQVQIPAQTGIIPGAIDGSSDVMKVQVDIPAQVVSIPEQNAIIPTMEPFRM